MKPNKSPITLGRAVKLFLKEFKPATAKSYGYALREMMSLVGSARLLQEIGPEQLLEFIQSVRSRPSVRSAATINKHVKTIRTFFNWCVKNAWITSPPPSAALRYEKRAVQIDRAKAMPDSMYDQLCDYAKWDSRAHALVLFLGDTGCRIGGAAGLKWSDVDLGRKTAKVTEKGEKTRPVFFGDATAKALKKWALAQDCTKDTYVFSRDGHRMTSDSLGQFFSRRCVNAGIGNWGPHSLRHRKGYQLSDNRISPPLAARALGHSSFVTTLQHYYPQDWERVEEALQALHHKDESASKSAKIIHLEKGKKGG